MSDGLCNAINQVICSNITSTGYNDRSPLVYLVSLSRFSSVWSNGAGADGFVQSFNYQPIEKIHRHPHSLHRRRHHHHQIISSFVILCLHYIVVLIIELNYCIV